MYNTTRPVRRARTAAAVVVVTAVMVGGAACGTDTGKDDQPAAPAQRLQPPVENHPHTRTSPDTAERQGQEQDREWIYSAGHGRPILAP
jgi:hypothetical protein